MRDLERIQDQDAVHRLLFALWQAMHRVETAQQTNTPQDNADVAYRLICAMQQLEMIYGMPNGMKVAHEIVFPAIGISPSFQVTSPERWEAGTGEEYERYPVAKHLQKIDELLVRLEREQRQRQAQGTLEKVQEGIRGFFARLLHKKDGGKR